jgi:hypothetical protein
MTEAYRIAAFDILKQRSTQSAPLQLAGDLTAGTLARTG